MMEPRNNMEFTQAFESYSKSLVSFAESLRNVRKSLQSLQETKGIISKYKI